MTNILNGAAGSRHLLMGNEAIARGALEAGASVVLAGMVMPPNYGERYTNGFSELYADLANEYDAALVPFFMDGVALDPSKMQPDQIHPNAEGQPILLDNVWPVLEPMLAPAAAG